MILFVDPTRYDSLKATGKLPSPKGVALAIINLLQRDDFHVADLVRLVQSDPAIAGRLLQISNAAIFARPRPIVSLQRAIVALGAFRVRDMVIGLSILSDNTHGQCTIFDYAAFWGHSLATAIACQELARGAQIAAEEIFTIGLLARVGELALASLQPDEYSAVLVAARQGAGTLRQLEFDAFGMDHRQLGATMLAEWGLPEWLIQAAYEHEDPDAAGLADGSRLQTLALSLNFASALGQVCIADLETRWRLLPGLLTRAARLGISGETLNPMVDRIVARWRDWGAILRVRTQDLPSFAEILGTAPPSQRHSTAPAGPSCGPAVPRRPVQLLGIAVKERSVFIERLTDLGFQPLFVDGTAEGLRQTLSQPTQIIIVDCQSVGIDLANFCSELRQTTVGKEGYVLLLASTNTEAVAVQAIEAGADDLLLKPVTAQNLRIRLNTATRMLALQEEVRRERRDIMRSADEFAIVHKRLLQEALTDPLTQLPNRRRGLDFLAAEWAFAQSGSLPIACLMMDIDHFKQINDQRGHATGDAILRQLADLLKCATRKADLVFRYGGEEFVAVLPNASLPVAEQIAERFRTMVEGHVFRWEKRVIPVRISVGVAMAKAQGNDFQGLIEAADAALYTAKKNGRNRVEVAQPAERHSGNPASPLKPQETRRGDANGRR
ncbi:MAG TPA: diguanylate cyclase [Accumulibacter sp.]|nr:diguanylate cyclase [Accumulibacter sp.]HMW16992.1 diguanylate cyclase [Accumulibacter sp.]HMX21842.1 diguanylate cyclase [Accumulibacter sp.]HMY06623.1 diguanylate cyclase [Accumulibacter sp.]HNC17244.1 diguanylate cyclase [Accumulibacter sp.]